jgi:hypothetical protein
MLKVVPAPPGAAPKPDPTRFTAPVKAARQLLANAGGDRATTLVSLDLQSLPFLQYSPGDHLMIYPENSPKARPCLKCLRDLVRGPPRRAGGSSAVQLPDVQRRSWQHPQHRCARSRHINSACAAKARICEKCAASWPLTASANAWSAFT